MKRAAIYLRVSTTGQTVENQRLAIERYCALQGWKVVQVYEDVGISGAKDERPGLDQLKKDAVKGKFDVVIVWKFDRLARSTSHLLDTLSLLRRYGVDFVSTTEAVDTSTAAGKMLLTFLGAVGEFERSIIQERVKAGLERARAEGKKLGRPRVGFDLERAIQLRGEGLGYLQVARALGVPRTTLYRYLKAIPQTPEMALA
ncbi:MAG: recombinase family protein [Lentisphaerae bacterium]|jgi:DNA invertase Pin-like site-specific DNA recombinase|nr:recombinase family protein [Lentisphaerota bacterium]MBT7059700.1 recombinase family protein [Lentisphaerota bacterium]